jgi:hypothetical protein
VYLGSDVEGNSHRNSPEETLGPEVDRLYDGFMSHRISLINSSFFRIGPLNVPANIDEKRTKTANVAERQGKAGRG